MILSWSKRRLVDGVDVRTGTGGDDVWIYCTQSLTPSNEVEENEEPWSVCWIVHDVVEKCESGWVVKW